MNWNEYIKQVTADAKEAIKENFEYTEDHELGWQQMEDLLFLDDSVTGNGSGSYYFNSAKAAEAVQGIVFDDEAIECFKAMGYDGIPTEQGPEACDVIARCICLGLVGYELEEYYGELVEEAEEAE